MRLVNGTFKINKEVCGFIQYSKFGIFFFFFARQYGECKKKLVGLKKS